MVFVVFQENLSCFKLIYTDNRFMPVFVEVLVAILSVLLVLVFIEIGSEGFPCQDVSAVSFIGKNVSNGPRIPLCAPGLCPTANIRKKGSNLAL